ncbi:MAG: hypothetical protein F8N15_00765 [Methanobacterium sp.]|nr:hypothetical protein [Methanobacterium sp.]
MTDLPIIFSGPMIRALLDDRKTQTRRLAWGKPIPGLYESDGGPLTPILRPSRWQQVKPGNRLWVRESCAAAEDPVSSIDGVRYWADGAWIEIQNTQEAADRWAHMAHYRQAPLADDGYGLTVPSIHMPRWASRLTLVVTEVRRQRLQDISEGDAIAEGIVPVTASNGHTTYQLPGLLCGQTAVRAYKVLWDHLHGAGASDSNPDVGALTFSVHRCNIDLMEMAA